MFCSCYLPFLDGCCVGPSCCENMSAVSTPHNHSCLLLRRPVSWHPPLGPDKDHSASTIASLVLRWRAQQVRVHLDTQNLRGYDRHRRCLGRGEPEGHAVDEIQRWTVVAQRRIPDLTLGPLQLDQQARAVRAELDPGDHAKRFLEPDRTTFLDIGRIEEVAQRRLATLVEPYLREVWRVARFHRHRIENGDAIAEKNVYLLPGARSHDGLSAADRISDGTRLDDSGAGRHAVQGE